MYLPSFYKLAHETMLFNTRRLSGVLLPVTLWGAWAFYPSIYNMVYTDFIPPDKGVKRRVDKA